VALFNSNLNEICDGECVVFSDNSSNEPTSWLWTFQGGTPATSSAQFPGSICYQTPGTYNVTLAVTNAGGNDVLISYDHIIVNPLPAVPTISVNGNTLTSSANSGNQWYFNGNPMNGFNTPSIQVTQSGNYYVVATNDLGCSVTSNITPFTATEIIENNFSDSFYLYPNPTTGIVRLNTDRKVERIEVFNLSGQLLLVTTGLDFDLSEYSDGIYLVRVHCKQEISNYKLIKAN
jgi:PKD repeat protein